MFRVYIAATELGFATPAQISLKTGLSDSYVRKIAKHLKQNFYGALHKEKDLLQSGEAHLSRNGCLGKRIR